MKWIKHDTDANQDAKLQNVLLDYGLEGYGLYWYCIELIAGKIDKDNITFELEHDARIIARNTGSTPQRVEEMMKYFVKTGLFECSNNTVTCMKLARRLDKSMTSNPEMRGIIDGFKSHDSIMTKPQKVMTQSEKVMQDKIRLDKDILVDSAKAKTTPYAEILAIYKKVLVPVGMTNCQKLTDARKVKLRTFWNKTDLDLEKFELYCKYISKNCTWMHNDRENGRGGKWGKKDLFYICKEETYWRVKEDAANDR